MKVRDEILLAVIIVVLIFGLFSLVGSTDDEDEDDDSNRDDLQTFRIGYAETLTPFVVDSNGKMIEPDGSDKQFYVVRYTLANSEVSKGLDLGYYGDLTWKVRYDMVEYASSTTSRSMPDYNPCIVKVHGQATSIMVFEVPTDKTLDDLSFTVYYNKGQKLVWSHALDPEAYVAEIPEIVPDVRIGYNLALSSYVIYENGTIATPSDNTMQYAVITFTAANDGYGKGLDLGYYGDLTWKISYNNLLYESAWRTTSMKEYNDVTVQVGGIASSIVIFEVPKGIELSDLTVESHHSNGFSAIIDSSLTPDAYVQPTLGPDVRIDWSARLTTSLTTTSGYTYHADSGAKYLVISFTVANDSYEPGVDIGRYGGLSWWVEYNGLKNDSDAYEGSRIAGYQDVSVMTGSTGSSTVVFEVPSNLKLADLDIHVAAEYNKFILEIDEDLQK